MLAAMTGVASAKRYQGTMDARLFSRAYISRRVGWIWDRHGKLTRPPRRCASQIGMEENMTIDSVTRSAERWKYDRLWQIDTSST